MSSQLKLLHRPTLATLSYLSPHLLVQLYPPALEIFSPGEAVFTSWNLINSQVVFVLGCGVF